MRDSVRLLAFGKPYDWSLRPFTATATPEELSLLAPNIFLPEIALHNKLGKMLYAPSPREFNAEVATEAQVMKTQVQLTSKEYNNTVWLWRGANADGVVLSEGSSYVVSPAGCPIIIMYDERARVVAVAHAGLRSLFDESRIKDGEPRAYESVVMSLLDAMRKRGVQDMRRVEVVIAFPIDPRDFTYPWDHPEFGELNKKRAEELVRLWGEEAILNYTSPNARKLGRPDLVAIIRKQCASFGVVPWKTKVIDSPPNREWHHTRQGGNSMLRNLVIVQHVR